MNSTEIISPFPHVAVRSSIEGLVFNIMRFAVNDGPGIRTTVFLKGCPLRCEWCHNPESILPVPEVSLRGDRCIRCGACAEKCPEHAIGGVDGATATDRERCTACGSCIDACAAEAREIIGTYMTAEEVLHEVIRDRIFFDQSNGGVTFSGGEPLLQHEFLHDALRACRSHRVHSAVDTTGYTSEKILLKIAEVADLFLFDLKTIDDNVHQRYTGVSNEQILKNLRTLTERGAPLIVRIPLIPNVNADPTSLHAIGKFVASFPQIDQIQLLPYHETGTAKHIRVGKKAPIEGVPLPSWEELQEYVQILKPYVEHVSIGG